MIQSFYCTMITQFCSTVIILKPPILGKRLIKYESIQSHFIKKLFKHWKYNHKFADSPHEQNLLKLKHILYQLRYNTFNAPNVAKSELGGLLKIVVCFSFIFSLEYNKL